MKKLCLINPSIYNKCFIQSALFWWLLLSKNLLKTSSFTPTFTCVFYIHISWYYKKDRFPNLWTPLPWCKMLLLKCASFISTCLIIKAVCGKLFSNMELLRLPVNCFFCSNTFFLYYALFYIPETDKHY